MILFDLEEEHGSPKRGDLVHTNCGSKRERTWLVLHSQKVKRAISSVPRFKIKMARWWELEPEMRTRLFRSAERNGGQRIFWFKRYPVKKLRRSLEDHMRRKRA